MHSSIPSHSAHRDLVQTATFIAAANIAFTLCVWAWIFSLPEGTFHDQGGLAISLIYFPATFCVWLSCALASIALLCRKSADLSEAEASRVKTQRRVTLGLVALGLFLAIGTL